MAIMKKHFLLFLTITIAFANVNSQKNVEIKKGEVFKNTSCPLTYYIGKDETGYYYSLDCPRMLGRSIAKSDLNLNRIKEEEISFKKDKTYKDRTYVATEFFN